MSLVFPYANFPTPKSVWALGGRSARPRPMIIVAIIGPGGTIVDKALVDTGAVDTVFSDVVATRIGIDLTNAPSGIAAGVGPRSRTGSGRGSETEISDGKEYREWPARVGFTSVQIHRPLLGFAGFLQFFTSTFDGTGQSLELTINASYAGT
jgi:hypothetical protein